MTRERFEALAEAYGGDIHRWPAEEREMAALMLRAEPAFVRGVLARADELDVALDAWRPAPAPRVLRERIIATAPQPREGLGRFHAWFWRAGLGAGLAAACAAGLAFGVAISDRVSGATPGYEAVSAALDYDELSGVGEDA